MKNNTYQTARSAGLKSSQLSCWTAVAAATAQQITHPYLSHPYLFLFPPHSLSRSQHPPSLLVSLSLSLHYLLSPLLLRLPFFSTAVGQAAAAQAGRWCTGGPADRDARVDRGGAVAQGRIRCCRPASIRPLRRAAARRWQGWARVRASEPAPPRVARRRGAGMADPPPLRCLPSSSLLGAASAAAGSPPPPLPTLLLLSAQRGRPWEERSSTRPRASGAARADRAARFREFLASLFRNMRTRRGYIFRPYPRRIRVGYVSDTGYAPSLPYPCF